LPRSANGSRAPHESSSPTRRGSRVLSSGPSRSPLASGLPFLIVRKEAKEYGTSNRVEGVYEGGETVCVVEDVVTSGGALLQAVQALREAGLTVRTAVCVVDREEGGAAALAAEGVRLRPIFRASELLSKPKTPAKPHG
jgi:orotate phosphoribosyltransferase